MDGPSLPAEKPISEYLQRQLRQLQEMAEELSVYAAVLENVQPQPLDGRTIKNRIRIIQRARRMRGKLFGDNLFADPAWDILLELYLTELTGDSVSVSSACGASGVPYATAHRWLDKLMTGRWVERRNDAKDGRRQFVRLTEKAKAAMQSLIETAQF